MLCCVVKRFITCGKIYGSSIDRFIVIGVCCGLHKGFSLTPDHLLPLELPVYKAQKREKRRQIVTSVQPCPKFTDVTRLFVVEIVLTRNTW